MEFADWQWFIGQIVVIGAMIVAAMRRMEDKFEARLNAETRERKREEKAMRDLIQAQTTLARAEQHETGGHLSNLRADLARMQGAMLTRDDLKSEVASIRGDVNKLTETMASALGEIANSASRRRRGDHQDDGA